MFNKRNVFLVVLMLAVIGGIGFSKQESSAIGGFLKNKLKGKATQEATQEAAPAQDSAAPAQNKSVSSEPVVFENKKYKYKVTYPGNWELRDDDPKKSTVTITDIQGQMGNMIISSTWMSDGFPVESAFQALKTKAEQRKKHGELSDYYVKTLSAPGADGKNVEVKGVVIVESDEDPDMKRMQWEAYGDGNYYNFTWSTNVAKFPAYKDKYQSMLDSIEFDFSK